ncbi:MAG: hypothetical protein K0S54_2749, partial [Alphaproteobacteria bacterium]|nr:hypothetical protein [Alphaproteobacteria bacterium]
MPSPSSLSRNDHASLLRANDPM